MDSFNITGRVYNIEYNVSRGQFCFVQDNASKWIECAWLEWTEKSGRGAMKFGKSKYIVG